MLGEVLRMPLNVPVTHVLTTTSERMLLLASAPSVRQDTESTKLQEPVIVAPVCFTRNKRDLLVSIVTAL